MAVENFEQILSSINNSEIRQALEKLFALAGIGTGSDGTSLSQDVIGDVTGNVTGNVTGDVTGALTSNVLQSAEHGAGAIGTAFAPRTYRRSDNGEIITEIHVDLTGLACKGDAADDAIGLAAGDPAYIGKYDTSKYGIVYKVEISCIEVPGEGTATITTDIDIATEATGAIEYDGAIGGATLLNTAALVAGETVQNLAPAMTADDYIYLAEGDTAAATGEYDAGQYIIRFFGKEIIT